MTIFWLSAALFGSWCVFGVLGMGYFGDVMGEEIMEEDFFGYCRRRLAVRMLCISVFVMIFGLLGVAYLFDILNGVTIRTTWDGDSFLGYIIGGLLVSVVGVYMTRFKVGYLEKKMRIKEIHLKLHQNSNNTIVVYVSVSNCGPSLVSDIRPDLNAFLRGIKKDFAVISKSFSQEIRAQNMRHTRYCSWAFCLRPKHDSVVFIGPLQHSQDGESVVSNQIVYNPHWSDDPKESC